MPTNGCSKGGELLATGQLSNSSQSHHRMHPTHIQTSKVCLIGVLGPVGSQTLAPRAYPTYYRKTVLFLLW